MVVASKSKRFREEGEKKDLFTPYQLGNFKLSHRIVLAPMTRCRALNEIPNEALEKYYSQRSTHGGLLITEATLVSPIDERYTREIDVQGQAWWFILKSYVPAHCPGIYTDQQVNAWKKVVDSVHAKGAIIFCQLWHVGQTISSNNQGSSILLVVEQFRQAAQNAIHAGFDGVDIHATHGYLLNEYLKIALNNDESNNCNESPLEGITKFLIQLVQAVVETIGAERVGVRLSPAIVDFEATQFNNLDLGLAVVDGLNKLQSKLGSKLAYLHAMRPKLAQGVAELPGEDHANANGDARFLKQLRDVYEGTFMSSGGYTKNQGMDGVNQEEVDLVAYGRDFLSNPDLVHRFRVNAPINKYVRATFYTHDPIFGYTDYPSFGNETIKSS